MRGLELLTESSPGSSATTLKHVASKPWFSQLAITQIKERGSERNRICLQSLTYLVTGMALPQLVGTEVDLEVGSHVLCFRCPEPLRASWLSYEVSQAGGAPFPSTTLHSLGLGEIVGSTSFLC